MSKPHDERRILDVSMRVEKRDAESESRKLIGYAAVFNQEADIGGWFREKIAPGAFREAIVRDDVRALWNHDFGSVLGRNRSGTLRMSEDDHGLHVEIDPPDTQLGRDIMTLVERGDVSHMSFGFRATKQIWEDGVEGQIDLRTILEAELFDVSVVSFPAYDATEIAVRNGAAAIAEARKNAAWRAANTRMRMRLRLAELNS